MANQEKQYEEIYYPLKYNNKIKKDKSIFEKSKELIEENDILNMKIDRRLLLIAISTILSTYEDEVFFCRETNTQTTWGDKTTDEEWGAIGYRKYTIENSEETVLSHEFKSCTIRGIKDNITSFSNNLDRYIPYKEIEPNIALLLYRYPYLEEFVNKILEILYEHNGQLTYENIVDLEKDTLELKKVI